MSRQIEYPPLPDNMISLSSTLRPLCLLKGRNLWTSILFASIFRSVPSATLQLLLVDHSISQRGKSSPSAIAAAIFHFPLKRLQCPVKEDYGTKYFAIFYVMIHQFRIYVCSNPLAHAMLPPIFSGSHLHRMAIYTAKISLILIETSTDMSLSIFLKLFLTEH